MKVGDIVKLKKGTVVGKVPEDRADHRTSTIRSFLSDIEGGVFLDRDLRGFRYWNVEDLEIVKNEA